MNQYVIYLVAGLAATVIPSLSLAQSEEARAAYYAIADKAAADYRDAHARCEMLFGQAQTVCIEEAKLAQTVTKGNAEAEYKGTPQVRFKVSADIANAEFAVAKARCQAKQGYEKEQCIQHADAVRHALIADAKISLKITDTKTATKEGKRNTVKKVNLEQCEALSGISKDKCIASMKSKNDN